MVGRTDPLPIDVRDQLEAVRHRIALAEDRAGRPAGSVMLLPVTKTVRPELILAALADGVTAVGENRVQEVVAKRDALAAVPHEVHLIGHLQRNKVRKLPGLVTCVQTVDNAALAGQLDRVWAAAGSVTAGPGTVDPAPLEVFVQVNVSGEVTKSGCAPHEALELAVQTARLPHVRLRGLMTIGANTANTAEVARGFALLRELRDGVVASGEPGTATAGELSMGMSGDMEIAIAEGATLVRVGTAIFGARTT